MKPQLFKWSQKLNIIFILSNFVFNDNYVNEMNNKILQIKCGKYKIICNSEMLLFINLQTLNTT